MKLDYFADLYASHGDDPWGYRTRFYELRKRALTVASLLRETYPRLLEVACSNGELAADLAPRCKELLACDAMEVAVQAARTRLAGIAHARVERRTLPHEWPEGTFDCIVISEIGYFLELEELKLLYRKAVHSLAADGTLVLCHWRYPIEGCALDGDAVHRAFEAPPSWKRRVEHREDDFVLDVWDASAKGVAERQGLL